jgi:hypothetical protein
VEHGCTFLPLVAQIPPYGNGWAAMGMTRVLATLLKSSFSSSIQQTNSANLIAWIKEIIDGAKATSVRHLLSDMYLH